ncbi:ester cyclase [Mycobacterium sp. SMC-4]|uniref:ester cyclase n=1 Tax=Mycobacterium sp. SMC-4 TaxID=2857059 RepID=UPI003D08B259
MAEESSGSHNKRLVRRFFTAIEDGDFDVFDEIVADTYDDHLPGQSAGRDTLKDYFHGLRTAFPDLRLPISQMIAEDDRVAVLNAVQGTHRGEFLGIAPTGRRVDASAFQLYRIEDGRLAEHWEVADFATLLRQLTGDAEPS